jgi:hypothetical protein
MQQKISSAEKCRAFWKVKRFAPTDVSFSKMPCLVFSNFGCPPLLSSGVTLHFSAQAHDHFLRKATGKWACKICKQISRNWNLMGGNKKTSSCFLFLKIEI